VKVSLSVDQSVWLELPKFADASPDAPDQWLDGVVDGMRSAWRGELTAEREIVVREALRNGLRQVADDDSVTLQYWPTASIVNAVVHVSAAPFAPGEAKSGIPLADIPYATQPITESFETDALGVGVEARYLTPLESDASMLLGGVNYLFENDFGYLAVGVSPTLPRLVGLMLEPLRDVVRSIRVTYDIQGEWMRCSGPDVALPARGEEWSFDTAGSGDALVEASQ
jgi:hypothetical protein